MNPGQELSNGFCYDKCPTGFSAYGALCLQNCPTGFTDQGMGCEPPTEIRSVIKASIEPCQQGQVDKNGDCFEPQTFVQSTLGPKSIGCGCIRRYLKDRIQCPGGYEKYNNSCVSACNQGYTSVLDSAGQISSLFCISECPQNINSKVPWTFSAALCVKPAKKRLAHKATPTIVFPDYGVPNTVLSALSKKPLGSTTNERNRTGQSVSATQDAKPNANPLFESWSALLNQPILIIVLVASVIFLYYGGPAIFRGLGSLFGSVAAGTGALAKGTLDVAGAAAEDIAQIQKSVAANSAKASAETALKSAQIAAQAKQIQRVRFSPSTVAPSETPSISGTVPQVEGDIYLESLLK